MNKQNIIELNYDGFLSTDFDREKIITQYKEYFGLARKINNAVYNLYDSIDVKSEDMVGVFLVSVFCKMHKDYQSSILLTEMGLASQAKVMLRCLIDKHFVLVAVARDPENLNKWNDTQLKNREKLIKKIQAKRKGFENISLENVDIECAKGNREATKIYEWSEMAGMRTDYDVVYGTLSEDVHLSLRGIEESLGRSENGEIEAIIIAPEVENLDLILYSNMRYLLDVTLELCKFFEINNSTFEEYSENVNKLPIVVARGNN